MVMATIAAAMIAAAMTVGFAAGDVCGGSVTIVVIEK